MEKSRIGKEWGKEFMAQHAILRFEKHKGNPARPLEAHHERQKEQYASNPDIDTSRSKYNFHIVKPEGRYYHFIQSRIEQAGCRTRKDSTRFVDTLITASPEFFKKKSPKEIQAFFQRAADFLIDRVGRENVVSAVVHMDEKTPHLHLTFVPLTKDNRLCAKEIIGNRANLTKWQDDFHACMVEKYPDLERGESASKTGRKHMQRILLNVQVFEKEFARKQMDCYTEDKKKLLAAKRRELGKVKKRIAEIDILIQKIYEDNASGKLSDERYATLSLSYEEEQKTLKAAVPELQSFLETETDKTESLQRFIQKVKQVTELKALTPELIHEFVDKIVVYAPRYLDGKRVQLLDIYYSGVGILHELTPEEMEETFQHHLAERNKEKTA